MSYLRPYLEGRYLKKLVARCVDTVKHLEFDAVAVRGQSGLLVGSPLAMELEKDIIIVRKNTESTHSTDLVENWGGSQRILIVDDFMESGETVNLIYDSIVERCDSPQVIGILLYASLDEMPKGIHSTSDGIKLPTYNLYRFAKIAKEGRRSGW